MTDLSLKILELIIKEEISVSSTKIINELAIEKEILIFLLKELQTSNYVLLDMTGSDGVYDVRIKTEGKMIYAIEVLFQKHKSQINGVNWTKEVYRENQFYTLAKQKLLQDEIILPAKSNIGERTIINPSVIGANSYEEAKIIILNNKHKESSGGIHIAGDSFGTASTGDNNQSTSLAFSPISTPPVTPTIAETKHGKMYGIMKYILNHVVVAIFVAVVAGLLVVYLGWRLYWWG
jgi:hypothetical protein